jgi:hypothetical protein
MMTLEELLKSMAHRGLGLRRGQEDRVQVTGDPSKLTPSIQAACRAHKAALLKLLPEPKARPPWWSDDLSDADNAAVDEFMQYGPEGPEGEVAGWEAALAGVAPCPQCGSLWAWWDGWGNQHCRTCDPPIQSLRLARKARRLRERATHRAVDDSTPIRARNRPNRRTGRRKHPESPKAADEGA